MKVHTSQGFTLIELLIVIALIAVLAGAVIIALNPARQFQLSRNSERWSHVSAIVGAVTSNITENRGVWTCATALPSTSTAIASSGGVNICSCIVPNQMATMPLDPTAGTGVSDCSAAYDTGYTISQSTSTRRVTVSAPNVEASAPAISVTQ